MYRLEEGETFLGRGQTATVKLMDDGISRRHARIVQQGGEVLIEDLKSSNGTIVNGAPVSMQLLKDGDKIRLGSTTILKFTYNDQLDESFQQQMYEAALRDGLTKAFNKKYFLDRLETEIAYARRHQANLSLLMFDVDHFKRVNDTHGHLAGDFVLAKLAKVSSATVRTEDIFARYGGEEFGVICRGVSLPNAGILGERLRAVVETTVVRVRRQAHAHHHQRGRRGVPGGARRDGAAAHRGRRSGALRGQARRAQPGAAQALARPGSTMGVCPIPRWCQPPLSTRVNQCQPSVDTQRGRATRSPGVSCEAARGTYIADCDCHRDAA